jgi:serine/threonine protein kinase/tetratricopeptide (TPR) repeat protein
MIGQTISHYRILEKLGEGGMGVVYKAEDTKLGRPVALKVLPRQALVTDEDKTRFAREAQAAASLSHPNVAMIHEFDEVDDPTTGGKFAFIAMEYVDGETVKQKIKPVGAIHESPLPLDELLKIAIAVAEGLAKAHEKGIIHRDIKSDNVMISRDGVVKIMDFGLAEIAGRSRVTKEGMTVGTVAYMSPEQALGEKLDQRTDIWSLGVVMYEMITGRLPFSGDYEQAIVYRILNEEPEPITSLRSNVPMELERIIKKAMQKDRSERFQSVGDLLVDLRSLRKQVESAISVQVPAPKVGPKRRRVFLYGGLAGLAAVVVVIALNLFPGKTEVIDSLAVLPLDNLSREPEQEYFVEGMHEALITELSKISALRVISRTSAMQYKGVKKPIPQIARELDVKGLIEGSVLREADRVRITVQLIHGATDKHLWARSFDRELRSILDLHSEVAQAIATEIQATLTPAERALAVRTRPVKPDAYEAYLRGRFYWNQRTPDGFQEAAEYFQKALESDPSYALAYAGLADNYVQQATWGIVSPEDGYPRAKAAATRALEIDNSLAEAHSTLGYVLRDWDWDWEGAERAFRRALELNPNYPTAHHWFAFYLSSVGRHEQAISEIKRAQVLDPLSVIITSNVGRIQYYARQYSEAEKSVRKALEMNANFAEAHANLGLIYLTTDRVTEAAASLRRAVELYPPRPEYRSALAEAYALTGKRHEAQRLLEQLEKEFQDRHVPAGQIALVYARLGKKDRAFHWLEKSVEQRDWWRAQMKVEPRFDFLRTDRRVQDLLRRMNFPEK